MMENKITPVGGESDEVRTISRSSSTHWETAKQHFTKFGGRTTAFYNAVTTHPAYIWYRTYVHSFFMWLIFGFSFLILGYVNTYSEDWRSISSLFSFWIIFFGILVLGMKSATATPLAVITCIYLGMHVFAVDIARKKKDGAEYEEYNQEKFGDDVRNYQIPPVRKDAILGEAILNVLDGFLFSIFKYSSFMFAAILLNTICDRWGILDTIRERLVFVCSHPLRQSVMILLGVGVMLALVAPGGTNYYIAGTILIGLEKRRHRGEDLKQQIVRIGYMCLFGNCLSSPFDLLGVCPKANAVIIHELYVTMSENPPKGDPDNEPQYNFFSEADRTVPSISHIEAAFGGFFSINYMLHMTLAPIVVVYLYSSEGISTLIGTERPSSQIPWIEIPRLMIVGAIFGVVTYITAAFISIELPCLLAGFSACLTIAFLERYFPLQQNPGAIIEEKKLSKGALRQGWMFVFPFVAITILLAISTTLQAKIKPEDWPKEALVNVYREQFYWPIHGALLVFYVGILTPFLVAYRKPASELIMDVEELESMQGHVISDDDDVEKVKTSQMKAMGEYKEPVVEEDEADPIQPNRWLLLTDAMYRSFHEVVPVLIGMTGYASLAKLLKYWGMTSWLAKRAADSFKDSPDSYIIIIILLGFLGNTLNGSSTTASQLFVGLQMETALQLGLVRGGRNSLEELASFNLMGSSCGELMSPNNALLAKLLVNVNKVTKDQPDFHEGEFILNNLGKVWAPWIILAWIMAAIALVSKESNDNYE